MLESLCNQVVRQVLAWKVPATQLLLKVRRQLLSTNCFGGKLEARSFSGGRWQLPTDLHRQKKRPSMTSSNLSPPKKPETKKNRINFEVVVRQQKKKHRSNVEKIEPCFYVDNQMETKRWLVALIPDGKNWLLGINTKRF